MATQTQTAIKVAISTPIMISKILSAFFMFSLINGGGSRNRTGSHLDLFCYFGYHNDECRIKTLKLEGGSIASICAMFGIPTIANATKKLHGEIK